MCLRADRPNNRLRQRHYCSPLDLTHLSLERQLAVEKLGAVLVATDLMESDRAGSVAMRLLHAAGDVRL